MSGENYFITINPAGLAPSAAQRYKDSVGVSLARIYRTRSGKALLDSIRYFQTVVEIQPFNGKTWNAITAITDQKGGVEGPGIAFSPDSPARKTCCDKGANAGALPHEILCHELVHAFRFASGKHAAPTKARLPHGLSGFTYEEFIAVLVTNIFISDPTNPLKSKLRFDIDNYRALPPELSGSYRFFAISSQSFGKVSHFCSENPALTRKLADVPAKFNPLAAYYQDPDKALRYSLSGAERDAEDIEDDFIRGLSPDIR